MILDRDCPHLHPNFPRTKFNRYRRDFSINEPAAVSTWQYCVHAGTQNNSTLSLRVFIDIYSLCLISGDDKLVANWNELASPLVKGIYKFLWQTT